MILADQQLATIKTAVEEALHVRGFVYDATHRLLFAHGISRSFLLGIPVSSAPAVQLARDLISFNSAVRLADGTVPLETWLRNALNLLQAHEQAAVLQEMLDAIAVRRFAASATADPAAPDRQSGHLPKDLNEQVHRDGALSVPRHDLAAGPLSVLRWLIELPAAGATSAPGWKAFTPRVRSNRMEDDLLVAGDPAGRDLAASCQRGGFGATREKRTTLRRDQPSLPVSYKLPEHEFRRVWIRSLALSYHPASGELRVYLAQDLIAACRFG